MFQIQIVVSKVSNGSGKYTGTDITIQALNREKRNGRSRKLPPLQIAGKSIRYFASNPQLIY